MSKGSDDPALPAGLYLIATPLGNARDITLRALDVLQTADVLAAEDTRTLRRLLEIHGVALNGRRIIAYHDHSGPKDRRSLLDALSEGNSVAYASDAGTPLVADPGYQLVRDAVEASHKVIPLPGPSALLAAVSVAGLPSDRFTFAGFPPAQKAARRKFFEGLGGTPGTLVIYESPRRLAASLADAAECLGGPRAAAVCRELTKKFEETRRGTLAELAEFYEGNAPKGEIVVCVGPGTAIVDPAVVEADLKEAMTSLRLKDAARQVAEKHGVSTRELYQLGLSFDR